MNWDNILNISGFCFSIFVAIFFSFLPWLKKKIFFTINKKVNSTIYKYKILNPLFNDSLDIKQSLSSQEILKFSIPNIHKLMIKNGCDINEFWFDDYFLFESLNWVNTLKILYFWTKILNKINYIFKYIVEKYDYIYKDEDYIYSINDYYWIINLTTISLCPNFHKYNLGNCAYLNSIPRRISINEEKECEKNKKQKRKEFIKELKSNSFRINFRTNIKIDNLSSNEFPYFAFCIKFNNKIIEYEDNLKSDLHSIENYEIEIELNKVKEWKKKIFNLD